MLTRTERGLKLLQQVAGLVNGLLHLRAALFANGHNVLAASSEAVSLLLLVAAAIFFSNALGPI